MPYVRWPRSTTHLATVCWAAGRTVSGTTHVVRTVAQKYNSPCHCLLGRRAYRQRDDPCRTYGGPEVQLTLPLSAGPQGVPSAGRPMPYVRWPRSTTHLATVCWAAGRTVSRTTHAVRTVAQKYNSPCHCLLGRRAYRQRDDPCRTYGGPEIQLTLPLSAGPQGVPAAGRPMPYVRWPRSTTHLATVCWAAGRTVSGTTHVVRTVAQKYNSPCHCLLGRRAYRQPDDPCRTYGGPEVQLTLPLSAGPQGVPSAGRPMPYVWWPRSTTHLATVCWAAGRTVSWTTHAVRTVAQKYNSPCHCLLGRRAYRQRDDPCRTYGGPEVQLTLPLSAGPQGVPAAGRPMPYVRWPRSTTHLATVCWAAGRTVSGTTHVVCTVAQKYNSPCHCLLGRRAYRQPDDPCRTYGGPEVQLTLPLSAGPQGVPSAGRPMSYVRWPRSTTHLATVCWAAGRTVSRTTHAVRTVAQKYNSPCHCLLGRRAYRQPDDPCRTYGGSEVQLTLPLSARPQGVPSAGRPMSYVRWPRRTTHLATVCWAAGRTVSRTTHVVRTVAQKYNSPCHCLLGRRAYRQPDDPCRTYGGPEVQLTLPLSAGPQGVPSAGRPMSYVRWPRSTTHLATVCWAAGRTVSGTTHAIRTVAQKYNSPCHCLLGRRAYRQRDDPCRTNTRRSILRTIVTCRILQRWHL